MKRAKERGLQIMRSLRVTKERKARSQSLMAIEASKREQNLERMLAIIVERRGTFVLTARSLLELEIEIQEAKAMGTTKAKVVETKTKDKAIKTFRTLRGNFSQDSTGNHSCPHEVYIPHM